MPSWKSLSLRWSFRWRTVAARWTSLLQAVEDHEVVSSWPHKFLRGFLALPSIRGANIGRLPHWRAHIFQITKASVVHWGLHLPSGFPHSYWCPASYLAATRWIWWHDSFPWKDAITGNSICYAWPAMQRFLWKLPGGLWWSFLWMSWWRVPASRWIVQCCWFGIDCWSWSGMLCTIFITLIVICELPPMVSLVVVLFIFHVRAAYSQPAYFHHHGLLTLCSPSVPQINKFIT